MTPQDLKQIGDLIDNKLNLKLDKIERGMTGLKTDLSDVKLKLLTMAVNVESVEIKVKKIDDSLLEWKSKVFNALDIFMIETKDQRDFREIGSHQINSNTGRIEKLEKKVFGKTIVVG